MVSKYVLYFINMIMMGVVVVTVLNTSFKYIGYDGINTVSNILKAKLNINFEKTIYLLAGIFVVIMALKRDTWLPFLGESVLPSSLVPLKELDGDTIVKVNVSPNVKVAYWAAKPQKENTKKIPPVDIAYDDYSNSGVVMSDENGIAILTLNKGSSYYVPSGKHIESHVHYRELTDEYGMMGPVQTHYF